MFDAEPDDPRLGSRPALTTAGARVSSVSFREEESAASSAASPTRAQAKAAQQQQPEDSAPSPLQEAQDLMRRQQMAKRMVNNLKHEPAATKSAVCVVQ